MRSHIIKCLKKHPVLVQIAWKIARVGMSIWGKFVRTRENTIIFSSFGGRRFDDSPKAIYYEICSREEFANWDIVWAFVNPNEYDIPRGRKVKIDSIGFYRALLYSRVWVSNSGMDRGIGFYKKGIIKVETWHGTPLKKIAGEENTNAIGGKNKKKEGIIDRHTIRCAQSEYDKEIFSRVFNADKETFILCDLPRNDCLKNINSKRVDELRRSLSIPNDKKIILYMPTYREYQVDGKGNTCFNIPIHIEKWKQQLGEEYILLIRAHYAVIRQLEVSEDSFLKDVSQYPSLSDLYSVADILISDYSSAYFDYSILNKPMLCYAYDYDEYVEKRGLYLKLEETLPCPIDKTEKNLLFHLENIEKSCPLERVERFQQRYAPNAGGASKEIVDTIIRRIKGNI